MRQNQLLQTWRDGGVALNLFLSMTDNYGVELLAHQGFDALTVDLQHGFQDYSIATHQFQAISTTQVTPLARVRELGEVDVVRVLDLGAMGVICPLVNTAEDAHRLVRAAKYPPHGDRSFGPHRQMLYSGSDYPATANDQIALIAMIETRDGLSNAEEIAAVEGIDALYVGPADLSLNLGFPPGFEPDQPEMKAAIDHVLSACRAAGKVAGIHCGSATFANRMIAEGFRFVTVLNDAKLLAQAASQVVASVRREA
ncbi:MAG: aldolase/citrate lyase family protein [Pseudomonadota bacterium]